MEHAEELIKENTEEHQSESCYSLFVCLFVCRCYFFKKYAELYFVKLDRNTLFTIYF